MNELVNSKELYDRYADAATALVMDQYVTALAEALAAEDRAPVEISAALDQKCRQIIKKGCAKQLRRSIGKKLLRGTRVAMIAFLILCGVFAILFTTVEAIRDPIVKFFIEQKKAEPEITDREQAEYDPGEDVLTGLLPEGYEPVECVRSSEGNLTIRYADAGDGKVLYDEVILTDGTYRIETEDAVTEEIQIGGRDALLVEKNGYQVVWHSASGEVMYHLEGNRLTREEIVAIAEAIESGREETPSAAGDSALTEPGPPAYAPTASDYVIPDSIPDKFGFPQRFVPVEPPAFGSRPIEIDIKEVVEEKVTYPRLDTTLTVTSDEELVWSSVDGEQTGSESIDWTTLP